MSEPSLRRHRERQERAARGRRADAPPRVRLPAGAASRQAQGREAPPSAGSRLRAALGRVPWWSIFFWVAFLALLGLQAVLVSRGLQQKQALDQEVLEAQARTEALEQHIREVEQAAPVSIEVRYLVPGRDDIVEHVPYGAPVILHDPVELEGYTFLGWEDAEGTLEERDTFPVFEDTVLIARYTLPLETSEHLTYLNADRNGVVDIDAKVTIRDFVKILYRLLNIDLVGSGTFLDVGEKDSCYKAAATLKDIGILEGNELYPDEVLRFQEMLELLERFYPAAEHEAYDFPGLDPADEAYGVYCTAAAYGWIDPGETTEPFAPVTKGLLAHVVNRVLGRGASHPAESSVGMILDVGPQHPYYADIAEAVIPHSYVYQDNLETWTGSIPLPVHEPGQFFAGVRLHCILDDGTPLRSTTYGRQTYNVNGELSTGDAELDRRLWDILEENVDPSAMTQEEMLYALYDWICRNFSPYEDTLYPVGAQGWAVKEATRILDKGEASCYGYAALFYELAYMIGYDPVLISGSIYGTQTYFEAEDGTRIEAHAGYKPYAWVEIKFDGISFIFDPAGESQFETYRMYYKRNEPIRWQRGYRSDVF